MGNHRKLVLPPEARHLSPEEEDYLFFKLELAGFDQRLAQLIIESPENHLASILAMMVESYTKLVVREGASLDSFFFCYIARGEKFTEVTREPIALVNPTGSVAKLHIAQKHELFQKFRRSRLDKQLFPLIAIDAPKHFDFIILAVTGLLRAYHGRVVVEGNKFHEFRFHYRPEGSSDALACAFSIVERA